MKGLFIFLVIASMLFFFAKLGLSIWTLLKKDNYFNNKIEKGLRDYSIIGYIVLVYAFSISLFLADDYTMAECNFTLIVLCIATALFISEKVYLSFKNRGQMTISSNVYDLKELAKLEEMKGVLAQSGRQDILLLDKEKFEVEIETLPKGDSKKMFESRCLKVCLLDGCSALLCIVILVVGLVRGV